MATLGLLLFIALLVAVAAYSGYQTGLIRQLGSLAGVIVALVACNLFGETLVASFTPSDATADDVMSITAFTYIGLFLVVFLIVYLTSGFLKSLVQHLLLGEADKMLGSVFRVVEWFLFLCILLSTMSNTLSSMPLGNNGLMKALIRVGHSVMGIDFHSIMAKAL